VKILFLAPQPFFEVRGTPLAVRAMVRALGEMGHEVDLLTYAQGAPFPLANVRHRRSLALPVGHVRAGASLKKLLLDVPFGMEAAWRMATGGYDLVHAVEEAAHLCAPVARVLGLPMIADVDSSIPDQLRESGFARSGPLLWAAERLERFALSRAAAVVTVCTSLTERVKARAPRVAVFQIEDPPLVGAAPASRDEGEALRRELGVGAGPVAFYSGNFEPYQGVELLVEAAAALPDVNVVFMGGEPAEIERLRARSAASGARSFFAGKRPPEELPRFLAITDVLVSPRCQGANTPFKIYTYLAAAKPLVATRIETHTQLLDDTTAFLVEPTPAGLAAGIRRALGEPEEAARRAAAGHALIEREYSQTRYAEKVGHAYGEVARRLREKRGASKGSSAVC
jgi:glycosyltransferase involved in cell wall biosynthesis